MLKQMKLKPAIIAWAIALGFVVMLIFINGCSLHEWNKDYWGYVQGGGINDLSAQL